MLQLSNTKSTLEQLASQHNFVTNCAKKMFFANSSPSLMIASVAYSNMVLVHMLRLLELTFMLSLTSMKIHSLPMAYVLITENGMKILIKLLTVKNGHLLRLAWPRRDIGS